MFFVVDINSNPCNEGISNAPFDLVSSLLMMFPDLSYNFQINPILPNLISDAVSQPTQSLSPEIWLQLRFTES